MITEEQFENFVEELAELPTNMRLFSLSLRSLCNENALGSSSPAAIKLNKVLEETMKDSHIYVRGVLPFSIEVVRSIQSYVEYYSALTLEEWKENLDYILEEVQGYKQCCDVVVQMHQEMMIPLQKRQDEANVEKLLDDLEDLTEEYEKRKIEYEKSAGKKRSWGVALSFIPGVNLIAGPLLKKGEDSDLAEGLALEAQGKIASVTILVVRETLIPALTAFIDGLNVAAEFFTDIENEMKTFQTNAEASTLKRKKKHYMMIKERAHEIQSSCRAFYAALPGVRTDLECLPEKPGDQNFVDNWLVNQKEKIEQECKSGITSGLRNMMKFFTSKNAGQLMLKKN